MAAAQIDAVIRHLRRAALRQDAAGWTDGQLLASFIDKKDEAAFEALVRRHGPMVFGVCRRIVGNHHDAEDSFQATFLVLARKASSVKPRERLANWLHGVARRTAMNAKSMTAKRRVRESNVTELPEPEAAPQDQWHDLQPIIDQEISGLPEYYRLPVILCDLEGKSIREATQQLGWPQGTLAGRLARARKLLAKRLTQRGVVLSGGALAVVLGEKATSACMPATLVVPTTKAAIAVAAGQAAAPGLVSSQVAALLEGVMRNMMLTKLKTVSVCFLAVCVAAFGGGLLTLQRATGQQSSAQETDIRRPDNQKPQASAKNEGTAQIPSDIKALGPTQYKQLFVRTVGLIAEQFETIDHANQYDGRIEAWGPLAGELSRRASITIQPRDGGGFFVLVRVDLVKVTASKTEAMGRDASLEQAILKRIDAESGVTAAVSPGDSTGGVKIDWGKAERSGSGATRQSSSDTFGYNARASAGYAQLSPASVNAVPAPSTDPRQINQPRRDDPQPKKEDEKQTRDKKEDEERANEKRVLKDQEKSANEKREGITAWGKEVGGLQAGLALSGERRAYHLGETVTLIVKVRNVGNKTVKFGYRRQFLDENSPTVTDADGKTVSQRSPQEFELDPSVEVSLEPGKETVLAHLRFELRPTSGEGKPTTQERPLFVGTGKVVLQYERVLGATGKLEVEVAALK